MFPGSDAIFLREKKPGFRAIAVIKQQRRLTIMANPKMVCFYRYFCLDLHVALVDCNMKGRELRLHHVCQGKYVAMHEIDLDGAERKIFHNCVDELWMGGKSEKLKKVQHSTMYKTDESEEDKEEVEGTMSLDGGDEVSIVTFVYPCGTVSVSSLGYFSYVGSSSKPSHPSLPLSLGSRHIQEYFKNKRGRKRKFIKPHQEKARN